MTVSRHTVACDVLTGGGYISIPPALVEVPATIPLTVSELTVTLDAGWSPYAQGTIRCAAPSETVEQLALDPRRDPHPRVRIRLRQVFGDSAPLADLTTAYAGDTLADLTTAWAGLTLEALTDLYGVPYNPEGMRSSTTRTLNLGLRTREWDHRAGTFTLAVASDEALLQDYANPTAGALSPGSTSVRTVVGWVLGRIGATLELDDGADGAVEADATDWLPGVSGWDFLHRLVQAVGLRLWCDDSRRWHLTEPLDAGAGDLTLDDPTELDETLDRADEWADAIVVEYRWTDESGAQHVQCDTAGNPTPSRVLHIRHDDTPWPGAGAAVSLLSRALARGRRVTWEAVSNYHAEPGQALEWTVTSEGSVASVAWRMPDALMTVRSRGLSDHAYDTIGE